MKFIIIFTLLLNSFSLSASTLDAYTRNSIPMKYKSVHEQVNYLIEPFNYKVSYNNYSPIEAQKIGNRYAKSPLKASKVYPITTLILSILPDNVALVIDENNKLVSFQYLNQ